MEQGVWSNGTVKSKMPFLLAKHSFKREIKVSQSAAVKHLGSFFSVLQSIRFCVFEFCLMESMKGTPMEEKEQPPGVVPATIAAHLASRWTLSNVELLMTWTWICQHVSANGWMQTQNKITPQKGWLLWWWCVQVSPAVLRPLLDLWEFKRNRFDCFPD